MGCRAWLFKAYFFPRKKGSIKPLPLVSKKETLIKKLTLPYASTLNFATFCVIACGQQDLQKTEAESKKEQIGNFGGTIKGKREEDYYVCLLSTKWVILDFFTAISLPLLTLN